jgi:type IV pilus assembly protein PilO
MAGLPRIVTLHDFEIVMDGDKSANLRMDLVAKTYRYKDEPDAE